MLARGGQQATVPIASAGDGQIFIGFDVETHPIRPGMLAPKLVCLSFAVRAPNGNHSIGLVPRERGIELFRQWLLDPRIVLIAHNATFDCGVMCAEDPSLVPLVFDAFADNRIRCTARRQEVVDVAAGMRKFRRGRGRVTKTTYALVDLLKLYFDELRDKADTWQLKYGLLENIPVEQWPPEARQYAIDDSVDALRIYDAQTAAMVTYFGAELPNQSEQQQAAWALHLQSMWGLRAERRATEHFVATCRREIATMEEALLHTSLLKVNRAGAIERTATGAPSKSTREIQARVVASFGRLGLPVPMTDPTGKFPDGQIRTNTDTLLLTDDAKLHALAAASTFVKHLGQWGPVLAAACLRVICSRYQVLMENGRTSMSGSEGQEGTNCFDGETEVLTPDGWTRFDRLGEEALIAQWEDGVISFVERTSTVKNGPSRMISLENEQTNLLVTPDHRCLIRTKKGNRLRTYRADEFPKAQIQLHAGQYFAHEPWDVSSAQLTVLCATQADGHYRDRGINFSFRKQRKVSRLVEALRQIGAPYSHGKDAQGQDRIRILQSTFVDWVLRTMPNKHLGSWVLRLGRSRLDQFCEEVFLWDGCATRMSHYSSNQKANADWVQAAIVLSGRRANLRVYQGQKNPNYQVDVSSKNYSYTNNIDKSVGWAEVTYCVNVPSSFLVVRRRGKVVISGNCQNPPRKGEVRPCFIPRAGWVFCSSDADTVELRALAYACLAFVGYSRMAEVLQRQAEAGGPDLHVTLAAGIAGISVDAAQALHLADDAEFANTRQLAKHVNFALAGGAGAQMFVIMAHGFGICLTQSWATADEARASISDPFAHDSERQPEVAPVFSDGPDGKTVTRWVSVSAELERAEELRQIWFHTWPEMRPYFRIIGDMVREQDGTIRQLVSNRVRGDVRFTAAANSFFSGLVADAMKDACWVLSYECYTGRCWWCRGSGYRPYGVSADGKPIGGGDGQECQRCGNTGKSPLYGSRPTMFLHDEPILEHPEAPDLRARAERQESTVVWCLQKWMPGIPFSSSYVITRRWTKGAKRLKADPAAPVRPEKYVGADGKQKVRWVKDELVGGGGAHPVGALVA